MPSSLGGSSGLNQLIQQISQAVGITRLSLAPAPLPFARVNQNADWASWMNSGYAHEVIPQTYTASSDDFKNKIDAQVGYFGNKARLGAGIRCQGSSQPKLTPVESIRAQIAYAQQIGLQSAVIWTQFCYGYYH